MNREKASRLLEKQMPIYAYGTPMFIALSMAIEALSNEEQFNHKLFVIGETCVEESKAHIESHEAIEKIRKVLRGEL